MNPLLTSLSDKTKAIPRWRLWVYGAIALFIAAWLIWLKFGPRPPAPGTLIQAHTAASVAKMERKEVHPQKVVVFASKEKAVAKLDLPPEEAGDEDEEVFEATDTPPTKYGSTTTTFLNVSSGRPRTVTKIKEAPWVSFERGGAVGAEAGIGPKGRYYQGDVRQDVFQVKGIYIGGRAAVISYMTETDYQLGIRAEKRW